MNANLRNALIGLALIVIALMLTPPLIVKVLFLIIFSALVVFCIIQFRKTANWATWALFLAGIVISGYATIKLLFSIADEVIWVQIVLVTLMTLASLVMIIWILVLIGIGIYQTLKNTNHSIN